MSAREDEPADERTVIRVPKMAELVLAHLRREIASGGLIDGNLPTEGELMERFDVSRPTIREALRVLEMEGLVSTRRGARKGPRIQPPNPRIAARYTGLLLRSRGTTLSDVYTARIGLEPYAARLLAENRPDGALEHLRDVLAAERRQTDAQAWGSAALAFHAAVLQRCGNETLGVLGAQLTDIVAGQYAVEMAGHGGRENQRSAYAGVDRAHARLVSLVERGDADGAQALWRRHLEAGRDWYPSTEQLRVDELLS